MVQTKDDNNRNALESLAKMLLTYPILRGHGSSSMYHSKFFMPKSSIGARVNFAMSWSGTDRIEVDPELLKTYPIKG